MPENSIDRTVSRRTVLKAAAATGLALSTQGLVELLAQPTTRLAMAAPVTLPDIQFDIRAFVPPAQTVDGVVVRFGPVFTRFITLKLTRRPDLADQQRLAQWMAQGKVRAVHSREATLEEVFIEIAGVHPA